MIALGSDHGGYALKQELMKHLAARGLEYRDYGTYSEDSCDYPVYGKAVAHAVADGETLTLTGFYVSADESVQRKGALSGPREGAEQLGQALANQLREGEGQ